MRPFVDSIEHRCILLPQLTYMHTKSTGKIQATINNFSLIVCNIYLPTGPARQFTFRQAGSSSYSYRAENEFSTAAGIAGRPAAPLQPTKKTWA